jgi:hypothetical protein
MITPHAFVFIRHQSQPAVGRAVLEINSIRRQRFFYPSLILSVPRRGWMALLLGEGGGLTDHLLLRNLSGILQTTAFELRLGYLDFAYRVHRNGRTVAAFESNLPYYINHRLNMVEASNNIGLLDLGEPIERLVLKRWHDLQHPSAVVTLSLTIPEDLQLRYSGDVADLSNLLRPDTDAKYVASLLAPGFNPEKAFTNLVEVLDFPYLPDDFVTSTDHDGVERQFSGFEVTKPATWFEYLPDDWRKMPSLPRKKE